MRKIFALIAVAVLLLVAFLLVNDRDEEVSGLAEFEVRNVSMSGLIEDGETVEVDFEYYRHNEIGRGDMVLFEYAGNDNYLLKSVYGVPGDIIDLMPFEDGFKVVLNGQVAKNSEGKDFRLSKARAGLIEQYIIDYRNRIPENAYFLLGNLESGTIDSSQFGYVSSEDILGRVVNF